MVNPMQTTAPRTRSPRAPARRLGYGIAIVVNAALMVVTLNLEDWGILPFLTDEFSEVVPWILTSLAVSIGANLFYLFDDAPATRRLGDLVTGLVGALVAYRILVVFPFDFEGEGFDASGLIRVLLIVAIVGGSLAALVALGRLVTDRRR